MQERLKIACVDIINLPNRTTFANPNLNPASTDFGRITSAIAASPRFIQFVTTLDPRAVR